MQNKYVIYRLQDINIFMIEAFLVCLNPDIRTIVILSPALSLSSSRDQSFKSFHTNLQLLFNFGYRWRTVLVSDKLLFISTLKK